MSHRKTEFVKWLTHTVRIRHYHTQVRNQVIEFAVQLETNVKDKWYPVEQFLKEVKNYDR